MDRSTALLRFHLSGGARVAARNAIATIGLIIIVLGSAPDPWAWLRFLAVGVAAVGVGSGPPAAPLAATPSARKRSHGHGSGADPSTMMMSPIVAIALRDATRAPPEAWNTNRAKTARRAEVWPMDGLAARFPRSDALDVSAICTRDDESLSTYQRMNR